MPLSPVLCGYIVRHLRGLKVFIVCFQVETKPWKITLPSRNLEIELTTVSSNYHVEINPSDAGNNDRYVVQEIIKV